MIFLGVTRHSCRHLIHIYNGRAVCLFALKQYNRCINSLHFGQRSISRSSYFLVFLLSLRIKRIVLQTPTFSPSHKPRPKSFSCKKNMLRYIHTQISTVHFAISFLSINFMMVVKLIKVSVFSLSLIASLISDVD